MQLPWSNDSGLFLEWMRPNIEKESLSHGVSTSIGLT